MNIIDLLKNPEQNIYNINSKIEYKFKKKKHNLLIQ